MKLIAVLLSFCLTMNVFASSVSELERSMDEYQFALTVEWDQKDQKFYQEQTEAFMKKMEVLVKEKGLTKEELLKIAEKKTEDKAQIEAIKAKIALMGANASSAEMASLIKQISQDMYKKGASWNGAITESVLIGLVVVAIVGYAVWFSANYECVAWAEEYRCDTETYYDEWGSTSHTTCGWETVCTQYEKKQK